LGEIFDHDLAGLETQEEGLQLGKNFPQEGGEGTVDGGGSLEV
jgi:hypothetical protein